MPQLETKVPSFNPGKQVGPKKGPKHFRASFSVLDQWKKGNWQDAVANYFHLDREVTQYMIDGRRLHNDFAKHVQTNKTMPTVFWPAEDRPWKLAPNVKTEFKLETVLEPWLTLVVKPDLFEPTTGLLVDFKTGGTPASAYVEGKQDGYYAIGMAKHGLRVKRAVFAHWNNRTRTEVDTAHVWMTPKRVEETYDEIITLASEMQNYLVTNNLYEMYGD